MAKYNKDMYSMYIEEYEKRKLIENDNKKLKLDLYCLQSDYNNYKADTCKKLNDAYDEINRLKNELEQYKKMKVVKTLK